MRLPFRKTDGAQKDRSDKVAVQEQIAELAIKRAEEAIRRGELLRAAVPPSRDRVP
jgi:hypothetical protein